MLTFETNEAPDARDAFGTGTPYAKIVAGASSTVDVIWTHANVPAGTFSLERAGARINTKILLNMKGNDCYQRGVPGIADSIKGVTAWLGHTIAGLGATHVRSIGISAGATAAILFGHALKADTVIAVSPEIQLGIPGYRSHDWNAAKVYPVRDVTALARGLEKKLSVIFPAWDISDFRHIHAVMRSCDADISFVPDMHNGSKELNWRRIMAAPAAIDLRKMAVNGTYDWRFDLDDVWQGVAGFEAIGRSEVFADRMLSALLQKDPENPGLCYHGALARAVLGDLGAAQSLWLKAALGLATTQSAIEKRCSEYNKLLPAESYERALSFITEMVRICPPIPVKPNANVMSVW